MKNYLMFFAFFPLFLNTHLVLATENMVWSGNGLPKNNLGNNGDFYLDKSTGSYYLKYNGNWILSSFSDARGVLQQMPIISKAKSGSVTKSNNLQLNSQGGILVPSFTVGNKGYFYCPTGLVDAQGLCTQNNASRISSPTNSTQNSNQSVSGFFKNGTLDCKTIATNLGGSQFPINKVCDVIILRHTPQITNANGLDTSNFLFTNNLIEFLPLPGDNQTYALGFFALLDTEKSNVVSIISHNGWNMADVSNQQSNQTPKIELLYWQTHGDINKIIYQINLALSKTSIR